LETHVTVFLAAVLILLTFGTAETASGEENFAAENGDVNADEAVDISDAITILGHLFLGNPSQLPPLRDLQARSGLPDTGQTTCYDTGGNVIDCESDSWPGQDGFYSRQQWTADVNGDGEVTPADLEAASDGATWREALQYCEDLELAGYDDWRLPNARELESIVDYERLDPCIAPMFGAASQRYWTSSTLVGISLDSGGPEHAGFVGFSYPIRIYHSPKERAFLVRAVRSAP